MTRRQPRVVAESPITVTVCADPPTDPTLQRRANEIADQLALPVLTPHRPSNDIDPPPAKRLKAFNRNDLQADHRVNFQGDSRGAGRGGLLVVTGERIELRWSQVGRLPVYVDLTRVDTGSVNGRRRDQPLARAVGITRRRDEPFHVVDATVGLGGDTWLLASLGCRVTAIERHPVVALLLRDGLTRAGALTPLTSSRITLVEADAADWFSHGNPDHRPDAVYLDPMFPTRSKQAATKKDMQLMRQLVGEDHGVTGLAQQALLIAKERVVIKRPRHSPPLLASPSPTFSKPGRSVRYDVYLRP